MVEDAREKLWEEEVVVRADGAVALVPGRPVVMVSSDLLSPVWVASTAALASLVKTQVELPLVQRKPAGLLEQFSRLSSLGRGFCFRAQLMHYASGLLATDSPSANVDLKSNGANQSRHI